MIFVVHEEIPEVKIIPCQNCTKSNILHAYKNYKDLIYGVSTVVCILDNIVEGAYNESEAIIAGLLLDKGVQGAILEWMCKATLLRVNGVDLLAFEDEILDNTDFNGESFFPDTGGKYILKKGGSGICT